MVQKDLEKCVKLYSNALKIKQYNNSIFESEDDFNILRTEMFKKLADKYLDL